MDDNGGRGIGGECCWWSGRQSRDKHGRDGEAGIGVGDRAIGSRRMEHPCGDDKRGRSNHFDMSRRWERRVIGAGEGMKESKEGGGNEKWIGGEVAAVDANHRGWDADIANWEMIWLTVKEKENERMRGLTTLTPLRRWR